MRSPSSHHRIEPAECIQEARRQHASLQAARLSQGRGTGGADVGCHGSLIRVGERVAKGRGILGETMGSTSPCACPMRD